MKREKIFLKTILILFILIAPCFLSLAESSDNTNQNYPNIKITGYWKTFDEKTGADKSIVQIYKSDSKYYGKVIEILIPGQKDALCVNCSGEDKDKPIAGLVFMKDITSNGEGEYSGGTLLDPENGKIYECSLKLENRDTLKVRASYTFPPIGRSQYWIRVDNYTPPVKH